MANNQSSYYKMRSTNSFARNVSSRDLQFIPYVKLIEICLKKRQYEIRVNIFNKIIRYDKKYTIKITYIFY